MSFCDAISLCTCKEKIVRQLQVTFTLRRSPNIVNNILKSIPDFLVMWTSQQEVTYSYTFLNIRQVRFIFRFIFGWKAESIIALIQYYTAS